MHARRLFLAAAALAAGAAPALAAGTTQRVSVSSHGVQGNGDSTGPAFSADGHVVAFVSDAKNLVPGDTNGNHCRAGFLCGFDVFARDLTTGATERVSVSSAGVQGNDISFSPAVSTDGRFVAFRSFASNLVPGDTNATDDVFVRDRQNGTTERVSISSTGVQGNGPSGLGGVAISGDGRFVVFDSPATNLVPGDTNRQNDVFVRDRLHGTTARVSLSSTGLQGNRGSGDLGLAISADGQFVAFASQASNLVPGDTNLHVCGHGTCGYDVFVRDLKAGATERVSVSSTGVQGNGPSFHPAISRDGRFVAFASITSTLVPGGSNSFEEVLVRDRQAGTTELASVSSLGVQGKGDSFAPAISQDGRFVAFASAATGLVPGDTNHKGDVLVRDRQAGTTVRVSVSSAGAQANGDSGISRDDPGVALSADGQAVAFASGASNLVQGDTNGKIDIFVHAH
jgi:Tol biopolymer transport system component